MDADVDLEKYLAEDEEAMRVYVSDRLFRKFADKTHRGHCASECACCCIEDDRFLVSALREWDDSGEDL